MTFTVAKDRIDELRQIVSGLATERAKQEATKQPADRAGFIMLTYMKNRAPEGRDEPEVLHHGNARPSIRLHGMTLLQGWGMPEVKPTKQGSSVTILSNAPQMRILLDGSPRHRIPKSGRKPMSFYNFRTSQVNLAFAIEDHPGFESKVGFVHDSLKAAKGFLEDQLLSGVRAMIEPVRKFFR